MTHICPARILPAANNVKDTRKYNPSMCLDIVVLDTMGSRDDLSQ